jgi:phosphoribosylformylglycinamidine (FGAM) synthase-like enzyme
MHLSRSGQLALSLPELKAVQRHFAELGREPTDCELETIAQTWSEHCSHKTLRGRIAFRGKTIDNLLKQTIFKSTHDLGCDWLVSVFSDNAGVVRFDPEHDVCFKVETHNHPSAIDPYGGANTGLGGVIRDALGTGLGAKPICNTDVFCVARPDLPAEDYLPKTFPPAFFIPGACSRASSPVYATTAIAWAFPPSTALWQLTQAISPTRWCSAEPSASFPAVWPRKRSPRVT